MLWIRGVIFTVLVPGTIALYVPFRMAERLTPRGGLWDAGWLVSGIGAIGYLWCFLDIPGIRWHSRDLLHAAGEVSPRRRTEAARSGGVVSSVAKSDVRERLVGDLWPGASVRLTANRGIRAGCLARLSHRRRAARGAASARGTWPVVRGVPPASSTLAVDGTCRLRCLSADSE